MEALAGLEYAPGTLERFQTAFRHTLTFLQWKYKVNDIDKMTLREVERRALTEAELQTLVAQQFPTNRLRVVRDIFLFSCYTGLA